MPITKLDGFIIVLYRCSYAGTHNIYIPGETRKKSVDTIRIISQNLLELRNNASRPRDYKTFFHAQLGWAWKFTANKYENANNSWHFHIISRDIFMLSSA